METRTNFSWSCSLPCFGMLVFPILMVLGARSLLSAPFLASLWELWAFGKTFESVRKVANFRGFTPSWRSLFAVPGCGCVAMIVFHGFPWFFDVVGRGSELFRDRFVLKRRSQNQCQRWCEKGSAGSTSNTVWNFKEEKTRPQTSEIQKTRQVDQIRPASLNARWRITCVDLLMNGPY